MSSRSGFDGYYSQPRGFLTPPPPRGTRRCSPALPASEKRPAGSSPPARSDLFHVIHKVPSGDSPYVRAKHVQLIDKDPSKAISLFWAAINSGDRVDSALKDMAVVMKQLDRSDEAIEAIKSFRHLCPPESQESIDNILVELYKQSGRVEEEIEMLRLKLKQVEQGMAFGGKRIKTARSQGKKVQITVEKEYSRLLGNLAWAYMQNKDYKFAEEHYRKALSFESDKNKQCNLAICLMHSNKLTEARFLLQAIRGSSSENSPMDESYAKSYERASQILVEFESSSSPLPVPVDKTNKTAAFTEFPYEKRADFDWRRNSKCQQLNMNQEAKNKAYESPAFPNRGIPRIPFTQPRTYVRLRDQESKGGLTEETLCRQLLFGSVEARENVGNNNKMLKAMQFPQEQFSTTTTTKNAKEEKREVKMSWADMVEEDEQRFGKWRNKNGVQRQYHPDEFAFGSPVQERAFNDENLDSNIILPETPNNAALHQAEKLSQEIGLMNIGSSAGYLTQPGKTTNQTVRRSLCFDQNQNNGGASSPSTMKALIFEGQQGGGGGLALSEGSSDSAKSSLKRRNRLQVFQDITTQIV